MTLVAFGAVAFALAVVLMVLRKSWRRTQSVLMVLAGLAVSGAVGGVRDHISAWSQHASTSSTVKLFGDAVPYVIAFVIVAVWFLLMDFDALANKMRGRGGGGGTNRFKTTLLTPVLGLLVPVAVAILPGLHALPDQARHGITALASMIG